MTRTRKRPCTALLAALVLVACGRPEPAAPSNADQDEICSGKRPVPEPTPAELRASSYTLADLGPDFLSNPPSLAKTNGTPGEPLVIPALPPVWNHEAVIPALPPDADALPSAKHADPVVLQSGLGLLSIDPNAPAYRVRVPPYCTGGRTLSSTIDVCVSEAGSVTSVEVAAASLPVLDRQLREVIPRWQFRPYMLNGIARPFCFQTHYSSEPQPR